MSRTLIAGIVALLAVFVALDLCFYEVSQTDIVLITQLGEPRQVVTTPGLHFKLPLIQTANTFDKRLLDYEAPPEEVILGDQRRLIVDSFTRYLITNPLQYYQAVGPTEDGIRARLNSVVTSSLRRVLGGETLLDVLSNQRQRIMTAIRNQVNEEMRSFGVQVVDVRITTRRPAGRKHRGDPAAHAIRAQTRGSPGARRRCGSLRTHQGGCRQAEDGADRSGPCRCGPPARGGRGTGDRDLCGRVPA